MERIRAQLWDNQKAILEVTEITNTRMQLVLGCVQTIDSSNGHSRLREAGIVSSIHEIRDIVEMVHDAVSTPSQTGIALQKHQFEQDANSNHAFSHRCRLRSLAHKCMVLDSSTKQNTSCPGCKLSCAENSDSKVQW